MWVDAHTHHRPRPEAELSTLYVLTREEILDPNFVPPQLYAVGLHPWWSESMGDEEEERLRERLQVLAARASAIGETGLDALRGGASAHQRRLLSFHLQLAPSLPLVLHCVRRGSELLSFFPTHEQRSLLLHDYQGGPEETRKWLKRRAYFSYGTKLFKGPSRALQSLAHIPAERFLIETDAGEWSIEEVAARAYRLRDWGLSLDEFAQLLERNFHSYLTASGS